MFLKLFLLWHLKLYWICKWILIQIIRMYWVKCNRSESLVMCMKEQSSKSHWNQMPICFPSSLYFLFLKALPRPPPLQTDLTRNEIRAPFPLLSPFRMILILHPPLFTHSAHIILNLVDFTENFDYHSWGQVSS